MPNRVNLSLVFERYVTHVQSHNAAITAVIARRGCELFTEYLYTQQPGEKLLCHLTRTDMVGFADWGRQRLAEASVHAYWRSIKRCLVLAEEWYPGSVNGAGKARWRSRGRAIPVALDAAEVNTLLNAITLPWLNAMVYLCLLTGMRLGEVCNLRWQDVDLGSRWIRIQTRAGWQPKTGDDVIPLGDDALALLQSLPHDSTYVFPQSTNDKPRSGWYVSKLFKYQVRRTSLNPRVHFHTLRHTFATLLLRSGVGIYEVSRLMRHASVKTTEIYLHILNRELHGPVNRLKIDRPVRGAATVN